MIPRKYSVTWQTKTDHLKCIDTDNCNVAEIKAIRTNGQLWINVRYNAEIRLRRIYLRLLSMGKLPEKIDYPYLIN